MMKQQQGSIISIGSRTTTENRGGVLYSATKAALHMFSMCLAEEVQEYNIAVNVLNPGPLRSEGSSNQFPGPSRTGTCGSSRKP